jgi:hypothetical protein
MVFAVLIHQKDLGPVETALGILAWFVFIDPFLAFFLLVTL